MAMIAIVDDNSSSSELLSRLLQQAGHVAVWMSEVELVIESLKQLAPHLVILDVNMPRISGLELLRQVRRDPLLATLPVVILSGVADLRVQTEAMSLGANDYILKGWDWELMLQRIELHLPAKQEVRRQKTEDRS